MQRKPMRNLLAWLLILAMLMSQLPTTMIVASGEDSSGTEVTRAEWLSALVEAFDMSVESGDAPDNYFSDLSSDSEYYDDILLAVEFGVVNIEAGEAIYPDEAATRDFAVTTLNYCLGFQLDEDATYSFSDSDDCSSPDDAQVAVDRGWVSLISGKFCPDEAITSDEMDVMLTDVAEILADEEMEEDHENSYTFADFVVEIDEDITVEVEEDDDSDVVTIYSTDTGLVEGDTFVVYVEEEPYLYTAEAITAGSTYITVTTGEADLETAVLEMDIQEVVEADLSTFEAEDDVESVYLETEEEAAAYSASASVSLGKNVTYKAGTLIATKEFDLGDGSKASITFTMEDIDLNKNIKSTKNFSVSVTGKVTVDGTVSIDALKASGIDKSITLGKVKWGTIGYISISIELTAEAKLTASYVGNFEAGFSYNNGTFRTIKSFTKKSFSVVVEGTASVGAKAAIGLEIEALGCTIANGNIYVTAGISAKFKSTTYTDGEDPENCINISAWVFTKVGIEVKVLKIKYSASMDVYDESNSPYRLSFHFEDGTLVTSCTRDSSSGSSTYVSSGTTSLGSSSYGSGSSTATGSDGETYIIYTYELDDDDNATITGYNGYASALSIPETIDGYFRGCSSLTNITFEEGIESIRDALFAGTGIQSIEIPDTVTDIGDCAFYNCENLQSVTFPDGLETIGEYAFEGCGSLESVELPSCVNIGTKAFASCTSLTDVYLPIVYSYSYGTYWASGLATGLFEGCSSLTNVTFEEGTTVIRAAVFAGSGITSIDIPDTVTEIETYAFENCTQLEAVNFSESVRMIGDYAFAYCSSLDNLVFPEYLSEIGKRAFEDCTSLTSVYIPKITNLGSITYSTSEDEYKAWGIFNGCANLSDVTFEEGTTTIHGGLFAGSGIQSIEIPDTVTEIGRSVFSNCTSLETIEIPDSVESIGSSSFYGCESLTSVHLSSILTSIEYGMFGGCSLLETIEIPAGVTEIYPYAFKNCSSLTTIVWPDALTDIDGEVFSGCTALTSIEIPDTVTWLGGGTFYGCENLTEITLSTGLEYIYSNTFRECKSLTSIVLPNSVTGIGSSAFRMCYSLTDITFSNAVTTIDQYAFFDTNALTDVYYYGEEDDWEEISIEDDNYYLEQATVHYLGAPEEDTTGGDGSGDGTTTGEYTLGNVNGDGEISYLDAMMVLRYDAMLIDLDEKQLLAGDVNGDGEVNSLDAIKILRYDAGLITSFE